MNRPTHAVAGIYARYSSDNQRRTSTEDQIRLARERAEREGVPVDDAFVYADREVSGAELVLDRPDGARLMRDALAGRFQLLIIEALDRFSRDLVDQERMVRRLEHAGIRIVCFAENYDTLDDDRETMRQIRGSFNQRLLREIGKKVHRGLDGQLTRGYHAGGLSFGYRSEVAGHDAKGEPIGHFLRVVPEEAAIVREIFERHADGWSCRRIAADLNERGVRAQRGGTWAANAIYGSPAKGSGVLNNELYIGRYVWNRSRWVRDPDTNRRKRVDRPREEWKIVERPDLAIVPPELWKRVRERMARPQREGGTRGRGQAPRTLFGGLVSCGGCGGPVIAVSQWAYGCAARKERGPAVCPGVMVNRKQLDLRLTSMVRDELLSPEALAGVQADVDEIISRARRDAGRTAASGRARIAELEREVVNLVDAVALSGLSSALRERLHAAEAELARLRAAPPVEALPQRLQGVLAAYRAKVADLQGALTRDVGRARELLHGTLGTIRLVRQGEEVYAEVESRPGLVAMAGGAILDVVAGTRFYIRNRIRVK